MFKNKKRILAIDPGTRRIGVALLENGRILYHGVKLARKQKTPSATLKEVRKIILGLITDLKPKTIVTEKAFFSQNRNASLLRVLVDEMRAMAKRKGIQFQSYAPSTVKKKIAGNGRATKMEVAQVVVLKYPELRVFLTQDRAWKERFHQNMFDAVAIGMLHQRLERTDKNSP